ncbi:hypothetical protein FCU94_17210 [Vibrio sp. JPW-9-11-11]|uniref:alginate lyase family protein n=1 Tax=Vibrio sp. JPW-9-11-11 TaxID=1416532 RepID=UPI001593B512|nr:alginate lyase family protein [Vibrio sp. JPW-9-11-11]NVD08587.1 hypothetical protein [Vibrio sp. JPW-9-11-11]
MSNNIKLTAAAGLVSALLSSQSFAFLAEHDNLIVPHAGAKHMHNQIAEIPAANESYKTWIQTPANEALKLELDHFPHVGYERKTLKSHTTGIYALALAWNLTENSEEADRYLQKATDLIINLAKSISPSPHTPNESILLDVYEAYSLIKPAMNRESVEVIEQWLTRQADYFRHYKLTGTLIKNNWENVRLAILFNLALILDDTELYQYSVSALKRFTKVNVEPDGKTNDFTNRDAVTYHAYNQQYYARILKAVTAYKGKRAADQLFTYKENNHGSIADAYQFWVPYFTDPVNNVHIEFVNTGWKPDLKRGDANKPYQPAGTVYAMAHMVAYDSKAFDYIKTVQPDKQAYTLRLSTWVNSAWHAQ